MNNGQSNGHLFRPLNEEQAHAYRVCTRADVDVVFLTGPAGTSKTHVALGAAMDMVQAERFRGIVLTRPAVSAGGPAGDIGLLPGGPDQKMDPWIRPFADVFECLSVGKFDDFLSGCEVAPLCHMRGRTFRRRVVILDEAQNCGLGQLRMCLNRLGRGGRLIVTGDPSPSQCDLPAGNCLGDVARALDGLEVPGDSPGVFHRVAWVPMTRCVRHPLVSALDRAMSDLAGRLAAEVPHGVGQPRR